MIGKPPTIAVYSNYLIGTRVACSTQSRDIENHTQSQRECEDIVVLIIDDDDIFLRTLKNFLKRRVREIYTARTLLEAEEILYERNINVVVCDYDLGANVPNGVDVVRSLKKRYPKIKRAMICSGMNADEIAPADAIDDIFNKGTDLEKLRHLVQRKIQ